MAILSYVEYDNTGGSLTQSSFSTSPIGSNYLLKSHVKVYYGRDILAETHDTLLVDREGGAPGAGKHYEWTNATTIRLIDASGNAQNLASGKKLTIIRDTPDSSQLVPWTDGSNLNSNALNNADLQNLYVVQEQQDKNALSAAKSIAAKTASETATTNVATLTATQFNRDGSAAMTGDLDVGNNKIENLATPTANTDAVTKAYSDLKVLKAGDTMSGALAMGTNKVTGVGDPTANQDAATKKYVDDQDATRQPLDAELTELATMASTTASALADLTQAEVQILDGATLSTTELNYVDGVTSAIQAQIDGKQASGSYQPLDSDLTSLSSCQSGSAVNLALLTSGEVAILDGATLSTNELNTLTGITSTTAELNKLDGVTSTPANLNVVSGMTKATSLTSNSDTELPTSKAVADHVNNIVNAVGGFVAINGPTNFPATQPAQGVVVSIKDVGSGFTTSSNEITITNGAGTNKNVKITGFPSEYAAATLTDDTGLQVTSDITNSTSGTPAVHVYKYHKQLAKESDVKQLSDDINDFNERYRVGGSNPTSDNHTGDLFYNTGTDKMLVYDGSTSAYKEVQSIGSFNFNTLSSYNGTGGNSASFNGSAYRFVLSNPPTFAQQLICSINGVVQKPNAGTSQPSEGFAIDGSSIIFSAAPASNAPFFIITLGSTVNIGTVSDGTITEAKLSIGNAPSNGKFLQAQSGQTGGLFWADANTPILTTQGDILYRDGSGEQRLAKPNANKFLQNTSGGVLSWETVETTVADGCIYLNNQTITSSYTMPSGKNGMSAGPITISGSVTIPSGGSWSIV
jgi:hypothetical protein